MILVVSDWVGVGVGVGVILLCSFWVWSWAASESGDFLKFENFINQRRFTRNIWNFRVAVRNQSHRSFVWKLAHLTLFSRGFAFLAAPDALRVRDARIAPATLAE